MTCPSPEIAALARKLAKAAVQEVYIAGLLARKPNGEPTRKIAAHLESALLSLQAQARREGLRDGFVAGVDWILEESQCEDDQAAVRCEALRRYPDPEPAGDEQ